MNTKDIIINIGVAAAVILGIVGYLSTDTVTERIIEKPYEVVKEVPSNTVGAVSGPDLYSDYFNVNGSVMYVRRAALGNATTSVCSLPTPSATTTLVSATIDVRTSSTTAMLWEMGNATTPHSTTTLMIKRSFAANGFATMVATSTALTDLVVPANTYINVRAGGAPGGVFTSFNPIGTCTVVLRGI